MPNFRDMQNEAQQFGLRADLSALTQRVSQLENQVHQLRITLQELMQRLELSADESQE